VALGHGPHEAAPLVIEPNNLRGTAGLVRRHRFVFGGRDRRQIEPFVATLPGMKLYVVNVEMADNFPGRSAFGTQQVAFSLREQTS